MEDEKNPATTNAPAHGGAPDSASFQTEEHPAAAHFSSEEAPRPYVRKRPAHRSVAPIDDLQNDEDPDYAHDSNFTTGGAIPMSGKGYRQSRKDSQQLRRDLHYGQYLEVPKGRKDIFAKRERNTRIKTFFALVLVIAVLAAVVYFVWGYMQTNWGTASWH